jgi:hypothetical protein
MARAKRVGWNELGFVSGWSANCRKVQNRLIVKERERLPNGDESAVKEALRVVDKVFVCVRVQR